MAKLKEKVQNSLDEAHILVLACNVLLGFQYRSVFETGFEKLQPLSQDLKVVGLALLLVALGLLIWTAPYHQIVERGEESDGVRRFASGAIGLALLPFALGIGLDLYLAGDKIGGQAFGLGAGLAGAAFALAMWYGIEFGQRPEAPRELLSSLNGSDSANGGSGAMQKQGQSSGEGSSLEGKIQHVLAEIRVSLPGVQALLGFQLSIILMESFDKLPRTLQYVHMASLCLIAAAMVLLMAPAAFHRLVEQGEETERFHRFASRMLLAGLVPLALGISGDFLIVLEKVTKSTTLAIGGAAAVLVLFYGLWFGYTLLKRGMAAGESCGPQGLRAGLSVPR